MSLCQTNITIFTFSIQCDRVYFLCENKLIPVKKCQGGIVGQGY